MSATDELKALLDERNVEYKDRDRFGQHVFHWGEPLHGAMFTVSLSGEWTELVVENPTPQQAVEATLGCGEYQECHATEQNYKRCKYSTDRGWCDDECKLHDCEGSFSAVNKPVWRCDCGAFMTQYTDATTYHKPRYCPNCGRKVKR